MTIFGIDPGSERTGYGVVEKLPRTKLKCLEYGCIVTPRTKSRAERLLILERKLSSLLVKTKPDAGAVESLFFFKNLKTAMPVSEARGVALLALAKRKIPAYEFSPLQIKMAVAGYGRAEKKQVQYMVKEILRLEAIPKPDDAADGLAVAIACSLALRG
ncbi:MAG TPA: crossover junction endodeoxyribonuclease RuvC [Candidatus Wildermuthbacteria bacterium]|uniref:Crossover junction endodeoxyribonuclease RuvC n=1 Tax=Candidatus Yanofskybacteria bacterium GW2011_GWC1_48_11 TaxID=1619027 RepID=A0A837IN95_9BACT|nr:MAG: Crossover junction endodeoxyribonuclease RuvC [Candidatus Yanofskybacteria bacterium GW2011_GWC1_48_11]KKW03945.1 MAG: Crossover junction endodeoxyribonuclease RuvC [Parcubacteria group bacterium GW2011_GWB1_49_12]KKW08709.1 MAG: Crossover junction endodeoxyribonuclease RuvC [Parcubacteria group bacterium GW2011_GWA1_49_26]KKW13969.1 MAG: Crossover junction endodeoxyribonuclease RuvC [Parcubacteria group bacterium GW2011_GWA2_50_10]OHA61658.1 MAG: crossover junction endodeoxyribonucleas